MSSDGSDLFGLQQCTARLDACSRPREVVDELAAYVGRHGFTTIGLGHVINPLRHAADSSKVFQLSTWKPDFSRHWFKTQMMMRDPIARYAQTQMEPFSWREAFRDRRTKNRDVEGLIREVGFKDGIAFPIRTGETHQLGIISLGADSLNDDPRVIGALRVACIHAYVTIERLYGPFPYLQIPQLTPRQNDILHYAAGGKSNIDIATIMGISPNSVRDHLRNASKRLGTYGRTHTIAVAMSLGLVLQ